MGDLDKAEAAIVLAYCAKTVDDEVSPYKCACVSYGTSLQLTFSAFNL
jgi:hypothetical protein